MNQKIYIKDILNFLNCKNEKYTFVGCKDDFITGFSSLSNYKKNSITWIKSRNNIPEDFYLNNIKLGVVQENEEVSTENQIISANYKSIFFLILDEFFNKVTEECKIGEGTYISANVKLGENVIIGHNCTLDGNIYIGDNTRICNNVNIVNNVKIGANCTIQSLTTIGEDGFGYTEQGTRKTMVRHFGGVTIEDDVFIGSHVNIARGTIDDTIIGKGVKIAPSSHIGHNVIIEKDAAIICSKVFGSVDIGCNAYISSCTVRNQCSIGDNTIIGMGSVVTKNIGSNVIAMGIPAKQKEGRD